MYLRWINLDIYPEQSFLYNTNTVFRVNYCGMYLRWSITNKLNVDIPLENKPDFTTDGDSKFSLLFILNSKCAGVLQSTIISLITCLVHRQKRRQVHCMAYCNLSPIRPLV